MPDTRTLSAAFAAARLAFGAGLMVAPTRVARGWLGADADREPVKIAIRGLGARDVALSAALVALRDDDGWGTVALAGVSAAAGAALALAVKR